MGEGDGEKGIALSIRRQLRNGNMNVIHGGGSSAEALRITLLSLLIRGVYLGIVWALTPDFSIVGRFEDSSSYLELAGAFQTGKWSDLSLAARRFFPGFPIAVAMMSALLRIPTMWGAILVSLVAASASTYLVTRLHGVRVAVLFACVPPDWLFYGSLVYSEALATSLVWLSIFLMFRTRRFDLGIGVAALAALARPQGAFLVVALGIQGVRDRKTRGVVVGGIFAAAVAASWFLYLFLKTGEPFSTLTGYHTLGQWRGFPIAFPFATVLHELVASQVMGVRKIYLVALWAATLWAAVAGIRRFRSEGNSVQGVETVFLLTFIAYFALEDSAWGFTAFSRFVIPVFPIVLATFEGRLPRRAWGYGVVGLISLALAVLVFLRSPEATIFGN